MLPLTSLSAIRRCASAALFNGNARSRSGLILPAVFLTLLVLSEGEAHGYQMRKEVERRSGRTLRLDAGTYYRLLRRLIEDALIQESKRRREGVEDARRRYYRLTALGRRVV